MTDRTHTPDAIGRPAYNDAARAMAAGRAKAKALWVILSDEHQRDGYALRPLPWEGTGEYQHVVFDDGRDGFIRIPEGRPSLPVGEPWGRDDEAKRALARIVAAIAKAETSQ